MCSKIFLLRIFKKSVPTTINIKNYHSVCNTLLLKSSVPVTTHVRSFWDSFPYFRPVFHKKDGLSKEKYDLVYRSTLFNYAFYGQLSCSSMLMLEAFTGVYYIYKAFFNIGPMNLNTEVGVFVVNYNLTNFIILGIFTLQNFLMVYTCQTCVTRAYYSEESDSFVLVKLGLLNPFKSKLLPCNPGEVVLVKENPMNIVLGNHKLKNERLFLRVDSFKHVYLYNKLIAKEDYE